MKIALFLFSALVFQFSAMAYESMFPKTEPGEFEIKTLPSGKLVEASSESGSYFDRDNNLFGPLFRYISRNDIAMTTPVEAIVEPGAMRFWISESEWEKMPEKSSLKVIEQPERLVASLGIRGGYNEENFRQSKVELMNWLGEQTGIAPKGDPYMVYWNGPYVPWFLKVSEIHVEIEKTS